MASNSLAYQIDGPPGAPLLVLIHSLGLSSRMWEPQLSALSGHFRVLRYEQRGHGGTKAPPGPYSIEDLGRDLFALLDGLGEAKASLCGLSLGGLVAMWVAAAAPSRVERLVVAASTPAFTPRENWRQRAHAVRASGLAELEGQLLQRWFTPAFLADPAPGTIEPVHEMFQAADAEGYASCCEALAGTDLWDQLDRIQAPTLLLGGAQDPVCQAATLVAMQERIAHCTLTVVAGASHLVNLEQPRRFTDSVLDHLIGSPGERGLAVRREILGAEHVDRQMAAGNAFGRPFQELITRYAWGEIWTRPGLDHATRRLLTVGLLVALGRFDELELHVRAALQDGVDAEKIREVLLHTAVYCGVPAANTAFAVVRRMVQDEPT